MIAISDLPCEVVASILRNLDDLQCLGQALLVSRHFYASFKQSHGIEATIIGRQVGPALLPYAAAVSDALYSPQPQRANSVQNLLDTLYNEPDRLTNRLSAKPSRILRSIGCVYSICHSLAMDYAATAWRRLPHQDTSGRQEEESLTLSPEEHFRFCRAFYRVELLYSLFRAREVEEFQEETSMQSIRCLFFSRHPPWENEQLGCVLDYLEAKFVEG